MPLFTPGRRWQPPFSPFKHEPFPRRIAAWLEKTIKGPLFGCRMCGNCVLQETAFICPMECPKGVRNGPCGGSTPERCYVDKSRPCIWYAIYERAFRLGREERLLEILPPLDWDRVGTATWGDVWNQLQKIGIRKLVRGLVNAEPAVRLQTWDSIFRPIRQPAWWQGDSAYHPPQYTEPVSALERRLRAGEFVITCEVSPPLSTSTHKLCATLEGLKPYVAAVNFTDSPSATPRMASWACSVLALQSGIEPVMQIAARDRTRVGLQAEVLGACALGVRNILCISGDSMCLGPSPRGRMDVVDIDSVQMLWILRRMRDEGKYLDGREIKFPPRYFLGSAASPFASNVRFQALREQKKVNAGAQFFQTNLVFEADRLEIWLNELARRGILNKVFILVGLAPLKTLKIAHYLQHVPGVSLPLRILKRMERAQSLNGEAEEGLNIALEIIEKIKRLFGQGVHGIHIMAVGWEEVLPRLMHAAGLSLQTKLPSV
ncbi:MAG: methylenetetrahydrofolate reductase C-terminal domain-containing protein [Anaerolineales bacterium]|nr:methylenetetrahydrofolate reductase C-terminal domain-containing protein [Anaerolineales bacterium]MCX7609404.1 methylenetetrahydrofolate reductase C-terminal domain-containing protein [Anaerolineales bacterium]MDW8227894.1 methylenetetrahydrofolate reductase C-terminal domain-containing protein [Anaerolineales bacterium]